MTVRQAAVAAARILQADDAEALLADGEKTDEEIMLDEDVKALATAVNLAAAEMSGDGFPIVRRVDAESVGGRIPLAGLPDLVGVTAVERGGLPVRFAVGKTDIEVADDGGHTVVYTAVTAEKALSDDVELGAFAAGLIEYLAARDYCLITGRTDEASIWDQRYVAESEKRRLSRRARLPRRRWA